MPRDSKVYLADILQASSKILAYTRGYTAARFKSDEKTSDAVIRNLAIIGEAAKNIPAETKRRHPKIAWRKITGLRDILVHEYFGVDSDILWDIVRNKIPDLRRKISRIKQ